MTSVDGRGARPDFAGIQALSSRAAGYAVARKCLEVQAEAEAKDPSLKSAAGVKLDDGARSWYTGALGEIEVGRMLTALGPEWFVRHAVPIGAGTKDVDHLVIGPPGVFAINTKNHRDASVWVGDYTMKVNGSNKFYVNQAQGDGVDVSRRLTSKTGFPVTATSIVAIINQRSIKDNRALENRSVRVLAARGLVDWLLAQHRVLEPAALQLIELAAEEPQTWHVDPHAADTLRVMSRFERLVADVGTLTPAIITQQGERPTQPRTISAKRSGRPRGSNGSTRGKGTSGRRKAEPATLADLLKLWFAAAIVIIALFMIRGWADQPCSSAIACTGPVLYLAAKPLLILLGAASIVGALIGTLVMISRMARR